MLNLHILHGTYGPQIPYGCTYIRLLRPLTHPSIASDIQLSHGEELPAHTPDAVILERTWREGTRVAEVEALLSALAARGIPLLYTLDDNLLDLDADAPWEQPEERRRIVSLLLRESRGTIVSTDALGQRVSKLARRVEVVPNALDDRLFGEPTAKPHREGPLAVGYMGSLTHEGDLRMVLRGLREALSASRISFEIVGVSANPSFKDLFKGLHATFLTPGEDHPYPQFAGFMKTLHWDLAISPLQDTPFHRCKSDLKYLDYAALGIPGVYSDVTPYRETIRNGETGLLAANDSDSFRDAVLRLVNDETLRASIARNALDEVRGTRLLAHTAPRLRQAITTLLES
ncbi:MAG: glycosyltransferase [Acidobacteria bacterium]|nr:glycosyltransferase [Acidobacteriota bacterium]